MSDVVVIDSSDDELLAPPPKKINLGETVKLPQVEIELIKKNSSDVIEINSDDESEKTRQNTNFRIKNSNILTEKDVKIVLDVSDKENNESQSETIQNEKNKDNMKSMRNESNGDIIQLIEDEISLLDSSKENETKTEIGKISEVDSWKDSKASNGTATTDNDEDKLMIDEEKESSGNVLDEDFKSNKLLFESLIDSCASCTHPKSRSTICDNIDKIKTRFKDADESYIKSKEFKLLLQTNLEHVKRKPKEVVICFKQVLDELRARKKINTEITNNQLRHLKKLEKMMKKLSKRIKMLEEREVDWDEENDSAYIQLERHKARFVAVHSKYCSILKRDQYLITGRLLHQKLDFNSSKYPEINRAIDKYYLKHKKMPTFHEIDKYLRKFIRESDLKLSHHEIEQEIRNAHQKMGNLIQRRRKTELDEAMHSLLGQQLDPAEEDDQLKVLLDKQLEEGKKKLDEIFELYTQKQTKGEDPEVSSDSEDSHLAESEDDEEVES